MTPSPKNKALLHPKSGLLESYDFKVDTAHFGDGRTKVGRSLSNRSATLLLGPRLFTICC